VKIVVPGNHEFFLARDRSRRSLLSNATVLINESIEFDGLRIWGSPITPLANSAFGVNSDEDRRRLYAQTPKDTDVLITHGPAYGILDSVPGSGLHSGCRELFYAVMRIKPKLHVFGHAHGAYGIFQTHATTFVNAALFGNHGDLDKTQFVGRSWSSFPRLPSWSGRSSWSVSALGCGEQNLRAAESGVHPSTSTTRHWCGIASQGCRLRTLQRNMACRGRASSDSFARPRSVIRN
jgi:hypothetical protein